MVMTSIIMEGLAFGSVLFLLASGLTVILSVLRIINFAHGAIFLWGGYFAFSFSTYLASKIAGGIFISIILAGLVVAGLGLLIERVLRPMYNREMIYQILITFGLAYCLYDIQIISWGPVSKSVSTPSVLTGSLGIGGAEIGLIKIFFMVVGAVCALILWYTFYRTKFGIDARATSFKSEISKGVGIDPNKIYMVTFGIGAFLAGFGGAITSMWMPIAASGWTRYNNYAFAILVIGGLGSIKGAYVGALSVGILISLGGYYFPRFSTAIIILIMAIVLAVRPSGMFGRGQI